MTPLSRKKRIDERSEAARRSFPPIDATSDRAGNRNLKKGYAKSGLI